MMSVKKRKKKNKKFKKKEEGRGFHCTPFRKALTEKPEGRLQNPS